MNRLSTKLIFIVFVTLVACVRNPVTGKKQFAVMGEANEVAMGASYDPQIVAQFGVYEDPTIQAYINEKGNEMAAISHRSNLKYEFKIMDSPVVNAFAVPGGYVYFTRGIMAHFNNEAEFAGVLGHEIGHITARHSVVQQRNATLAQLGLIAGMVAKPELAQFANTASTGLQLLFLKFGRDAESQSDELGVEYSTKIGYDAREMAEFFNTLSRKSAAAGAAIPEFLSTHPNPLNRRERVAELATQRQRKSPGKTFKVGRDEYLQMLEGLVYGEDPRQGFVENSNFYHPGMKFWFPVPQGWLHQNSPQQFQMAPQDQNALMFLALAQGEDLQTAATNTISGYNLEVLASRNLTLNGLPALEVDAISKVAEAQPGQAQTEAQPRVKAKLTFIQHNSMIFQLTGVASETDFSTYAPHFDNTMENFKILTEPDKLNREPERITLEKLTQNTTLAQALTSYGIPQERHEELAVVNGMMTTDMVPAGTTIKVLK